MKEFTIIGSKGLVGKQVVKFLKEQNVDFTEVLREDSEMMLAKNHNRVIYCAGENRCDLENLENLIESNTKFLSDIISAQNFEHLTYFSSTRLYLLSDNTGPDLPITISISDPRFAFNSSKLLGEASCLLSKKPVCIVRPSNIYGMSTTSNLFLPSITRDAVSNGVVNMYVDKSYSKDYVSVVDVAKTVINLANNAKEGIFNIASGINTKAEDIAKVLIDNTSCNVIWHKNTNNDKFLTIDISKTAEAVPDFKPRSLLKDLEELINEFKS